MFDACTPIDYSGGLVPQMVVSDMGPVRVSGEMSEIFNTGIAQFVCEAPGSPSSNILPKGIE